MSAHQLITDHLDLWTQAITQKSTAGRGGASVKSGKIELTGIKRLRELILELAMRGKLVEQDPDNEPADELLQRIEEEKNRLAKEGKIKKPKKLPDALDDEKLFSLPYGWQWASIARTGIASTGKTPSTKIKSFFDGDIPFIGPGQITPSGRINTPDKFISEEGILESDEALPGDIVVVCIGGSIGKCAKVQERCGFNQQINKIRPMLVHSDYLLSALSTDFIQKTILEKSTGSATPIINRSKWESICIPLPPINEQHRIVQKVGDLMALCDRLEQHTSDQLGAHETLVDTLLVTLTQSANAVELVDNWARLAEHFDTLFITEKSINKLKQTILQLGMMGLLTEPNHGLASHPIPLEILKAEREAISRKERIKIPKLPAESSADVVPYKLPASWLWARVGEVVALKHGYAFKSNYFSEREGLFVLTTPGNFYETGGFRDRGIKTKYYEGPIDDEFVLTAHDLIIPMTEQAPGLLGSAAFIPENEKKYLHNQRLGKLFFNKTHFDPRFIYWFFNSKLLRDELARTRSGTTVRHTSPSKVAAAFIPVPDLRTQTEIALKIDELMALCDLLKERLNQASDTRCQLAGAVVEGALS